MAAGDCVAVCAACGARVHVPHAAGMKPSLQHEDGCTRTFWPILGAIQYDDGTQATTRDWVAR